MTIAMAAFAGASNIVTVSDARLSYGEMVPAEDAATMKSRRISRKWGMMFAAEDATAFSPVVAQVVRELVGDFTVLDKANERGYQAVAKIVQDAYEKEFSERFFRENLARFGYSSIAEFRQSGFVEMGKDLYYQYTMALAKYDLGLELLGYGFSATSTGYIFEVANPGKIISHNLRGFAAIGSGSLMALAALNRKPKSNGLSETIYRLLDAKFSSETARDVGKKTYVIVLNAAGEFNILKQGVVEKVREIWDEAQKQPDSAEAIEILGSENSYTKSKGATDPDPA